MNQQSFGCRICSPMSSDSEIRLALKKQLPMLSWTEGDSSWDKVHVVGKSPQLTIDIYRYESPGPFKLTIVREESDGAALEPSFETLRDQVIVAIQGFVQQRLQPQPVPLIQLHGRFPTAYAFESSRTLAEMKQTLDDAEFWFWEMRRQPSKDLRLEGRIPFQCAGREIWTAQERVRISGETPTFSIEVGLWQDQKDRVPACEQVHRTVQDTLLPALGAQNVRAVLRVDQ